MIWNCRDFLMLFSHNFRLHPIKVLVSGFSSTINLNFNSSLTFSLLSDWKYLLRMHTIMKININRCGFHFSSPQLFFFFFLDSHTTIVDASCLARMHKSHKMHFPSSSMRQTSEHDGWLRVIVASSSACSKLCILLSSDLRKVNTLSEAWLSWEKHCKFALRSSTQIIASINSKFFNVFFHFFLWFYQDCCNLRLHQWKMLNRAICLIS